jgi:hypothetical protein
MDAAMAGRYTPIWSDWIIAETWRILTEKWLVKQSRPAAGLSTAAKAMMRIMAPLCGLERSLPRIGPGAWPSLGDPDDEPVWNTAMHAKAQFVVSQNTEDFPPADPHGRRVWEGVEYVVPNDFLARIGWPPDEEDVGAGDVA